MDWPEISQVLYIRPITDERKNREWIKLNKNRKKKEGDKEKITEKPHASSNNSGKIDIYV